MAPQRIRIYPMQILYEDNHLIAVYKPTGVLVQGDKSGDKCLMDLVKDYLKEKYKKTGNVYLGLVHRLDRNVQGIVLFAKTSKGASRLSEQFREHAVEKIYHAIVEGKMKKEKETLAHWLKKDEKTNKTTVYGLQTTGAQRADLSYEVVATLPPPLSPPRAGGRARTLLKIKLGTGRSHQIRAQLSAIGHPIVGDVKYGAKEVLKDQSIALAATSLTFKTATGDEEKTIEVEVPKEWKNLI